MLLKRFYDAKLAQASYMVASSASGDALIVDPNRDAQQYLDAAATEGVRITHVTETHIHADFVSGARELAQRAGARLLLSDEGDADWKYEYAAAAGAVLLHDGESLMVGNIMVEALHTPGHTPEHLSFLITDTPATDRPVAMFTGDFIFAGDVGRPDLLERAAHAEGTMVEAARTLYRSIQKFRKLPDYLQMWPGHGAGSACGKALGAVPSTTVGYEKIANWGLTATSEAEFVRMVLADQPEPPKYFAAMKRINKAGPPLVHGFRRPERLLGTRVVDTLDREAIMIDVRPAADYARSHIPGTINIPLTRSFTTWAGSLIPYDRPIHLITTDDEGRSIDEAVRDLSMIGLDDVAGYMGADALTAWDGAGRRLTSTRQMDVADLPMALDEDAATVIDVRGRAEWDRGHIAGARHIPLGYLADHIDEVPKDRPIVVHCQSGGRSAIAASVLEAKGIHGVVNLTEGFAGWKAAGNPVVRGDAG